MAVLMLVMVLVPAEFWHRGANDAVYHGFDPNLIYVNGFDPNLIYVDEQGGEANSVAEVSSASIKLTALHNQRPTAFLLSSDRDFQAAFDVTILHGVENSVPLRIGVWRIGRFKPIVEAGYFVDFGPPPANLIAGWTIAGGSFSRPVSPGSIIGTDKLGQYAPGQTLHVQIELDSRTKRLITRVSQANGGQAEPALGLSSVVTAIDAPQLFQTIYVVRPVSLSVSALSAGGQAQSVIDNYVVTLPARRSWATRIDDARATGIMLALVAAGSLLCAITIASWVRKQLVDGAGRSPAKTFRQWSSRTVTIRSSRLVLIGLGLAYVIANVLLFSISSINNNLTANSVDAYIAAHYGPTDLYFLGTINSANLISWGGKPYVSGFFMDGPLAAYLFTGIGWVYRLFVAGPSGSPLDLARMGWLMKFVGVQFALVDAVLIYMIARELKLSSRMAYLVCALFLLSPALLLTTSVWGRTFPESIFLLLAAVWLGQKRAPFWAWLSLAGAVVNRPQLLPPAFILGLVFLRTFSFKQNVSGICWSIIAGFVILAPLTLATSPSLPLDNLRYVSSIQNTPAVDVARYQVVSGGAYNLWPLITGLFHGASGKDRFDVMQSMHVVGDVSYLQLSNVLFYGAMFVIASAVIVGRHRARSVSDYVPLLAAGMLALMTLKTGIEGDHFVLALPLVLLARKPLGGLAYSSIFVILSFTVLVTSFAQLGGLISLLPPHLEPVLHPRNSAVTRFFQDLYTNDRFITLGAAANLLAFIWLTAAAVREHLPGRGEWQAESIDRGGGERTE